MKGIFLAFVCAIALTSASDLEEEIIFNNRGCPVDNMIQHYLPHEYCDRYYICVAGTPTIIRCPEGTLYHTKENVCDWTQNVDCGDRNPAPEIEEPEPEPTTTVKPLYGFDDPSQAAEICARPDSDNILISHEDCSKYYQCWLGRTITLSCPSNLFYNPKIGGCDWQRNVDCKNPEVDDSHLSEPERLCNKGSFLVPHENYCNWFYKCGPAGPSAQPCFEGTVFDYKIQTCNWPIYVNCGDKIIKPVEEEKEEEKEEEEVVEEEKEEEKEEEEVVEEEKEEEEEVIVEGEKEEEVIVEEDKEEEVVEEDKEEEIIVIIPEPETQP